MTKETSQWEFAARRRNPWRGWISGSLCKYPTGPNRCTTATACKWDGVWSRPGALAICSCRKIRNRLSGRPGNSSPPHPPGVPSFRRGHMHQHARAHKPRSSPARRTMRQEVAAWHVQEATKSNRSLCRSLAGSHHVPGSGTRRFTIPGFRHPPRPRTAPPSTGRNRSLRHARARRPARRLAPRRRPGEEDAAVRPPKSRFWKLWRLAR
jgi:hypothetical protein